MLPELETFYTPLTCHPKSCLSHYESFAGLDFTFFRSSVWASASCGRGPQIAQARDALCGVFGFPSDERGLTFVKSYRQRASYAAGIIKVSKILPFS